GGGGDGGGGGGPGGGAPRGTRGRRPARQVEPVDERPAAEQDAPARVGLHQLQRPDDGRLLIPYKMALPAGGLQLLPEPLRRVGAGALVADAVARRQRDGQAGLVAGAHHLADALQERFARATHASSFHWSRTARAAGAGKSRAAAPPAPGPGRRVSQPSGPSQRKSGRASRCASRYSHGRRSTAAARR